MLDVKNHQRSSALSECGVVMLPKGVLYVGLIASVFFIILVVASWGTGDSRWPTAVFAIFALLALGLVVAYFTCRVSYDRDGFTVSNLLGIKRRWSYLDIECIQYMGKDIRIHVGGRTVRIDAMMMGVSGFLARARKVYRTKKNGCAIPNVTVGFKNKLDLFNGHILCPGEFLFIYGMILILMLAVLIVMTVMGLKEEPYKAEELEYARSTINVCETKNRFAYVTLENDERVYKLRGFEDTLPEVDTLEKLYREQITVTVGYYAHGEGKVTEYIIYSLVDDAGRIYLTPEQAHEYYMQTDFTWVFMLFGGMTLLWCGFCVMSVVVGRNPQKYSKRVIGLFFRDGYVIF